MNRLIPGTPALVAVTSGEYMPVSRKRPADPCCCALVRNFTVAAMLVILAGCASGNTIRIDSSTDETFQSTFGAMTRSLSRNQLVRFNSALLQIRGVGDESAAQSAAQSEVPASPVTRPTPALKDLIDGMTYAEILELAKRSESDPNGTQ